MSKLLFYENLCGPEKGRFVNGWVRNEMDLFAGGVFGHCLGTFGDGVFGQFTRQQKTDSGLHLSGSDGGSFVVVGQTGCFRGNSLEDVIHERVHDGHGLRGDSSVRVHLLQHLVDVD